MSKKPNLAAAMATAAGKPSAKPSGAEPAVPAGDVVEAVAGPTARRPGDAGYRIPSRQGKKIMAMHVAPEAHRQVAIYAAEHSLKIEQVLREAMNAWAESKGLPPIY